MLADVSATYENHRNLVKAVVALALSDVTAGHRARRFDMPVLGNRLFSGEAYAAYLDNANKQSPDTFPQWYAKNHERASIKIECGEDATESLSTPELRELCELADVYLPEDCADSIVLLHRRAECGEM